ncbi:MAG: hypothetical protein A2Y62_06485 [Candidatus Fischerbacteria bacterium RBG_13_37_8]|uniref:O-methyltransferase dimerisation domain-containing protein n=1 Tax=Candidatus Fischerbacteria bacterium RBG_13_37_8 TaxID=1817863 RepID=A0A1F5VDW3_9BACT|nr:MAG: hypothetical protein A2Y62_06485 [Candidatus Fischerbacteria bacterium RBG_13_37_8]
MTQRHSKALIEYTPESFRELLFGFQVSRVILTAYELELFTAIGSSSVTSSQVAKKTRTNVKATERLRYSMPVVSLSSRSLL